MKIEKIKNREHLFEYVTEKINKIKRLINDNNKAISGVKFEVFGYNDFEYELNEEADYNILLIDFMFSRLGLVTENFTLLSSQDKVYDFLGNELKKECRKVIRNTQGGIKTFKNNFDYRMKFWIKTEIDSKIEKGKKVIIKEQINFIFKIVLMKYN